MRTISDTVIILSQELFVTSGPPVRKKQTNVSLRWKNFLHPQFLKTHSKSFAAELCANISITLCWPKVSTQFQKVQNIAVNLEFVCQKLKLAHIALVF